MREWPAALASVADPAKRHCQLPRGALSALPRAALPCLSAQHNAFLITISIRWQQPINRIGPMQSYSHLKMHEFGCIGDGDCTPQR